MFSQTLGTALGDWTSDSAGLGYSGSAIIFGLLLAVIIGLYYWTHVSRTVLFWAAFILTRPLGAVVGDLLDKPVASGGLALSRYSASAALLAFIVACPIAWFGLENFLTNYPYRISISWWILPLVGLVALLLTVLIVIFQALRAASVSASESLKCE